MAAPPRRHLLLPLRSSSTPAPTHPKDEGLKELGDGDHKVLVEITRHRFCAPLGGDITTGCLSADCVDYPLGFELNTCMREAVRAHSPFHLLATIHSYGGGSRDFSSHTDGQNQCLHQSGVELGRERLWVMRLAQRERASLCREVVAPGEPSPWKGGTVPDKAGVAPPWDLPRLSPPLWWGFEAPRAGSVPSKGPGPTASLGPVSASWRGLSID
jgi:hypothetical protein